MELDQELHNGLPLADRNRYIEKAWRMLPQFRQPDVLDVGCGPGGPTLKLARLGGGRVTGLDTSRPDLARLAKRSRAENLSDRFRAVHGSMLDMPFTRHSFDIVWSEGSIFVIGFERGLREWRWLLKPGGAVVVHDMCWLRPDPPREIAEYWRALYPGISTVEGSIAIVDTCDYDLLGWFTLPEDAWWDLYFGPLQDRVDALRHKYAGDDATLGVLNRGQRDIDLYRRHRRWYGSAYFVLQAAGE